MTTQPSNSIQQHWSNRFCLAFSGVLLLACFAIPSAAQAQSQTVQLPVFRNFVYRGAVKVPDGGTTLLGGVGSSSEGASSSGVPLLGGIPGVGRGFRNRGIGRASESAKAAVKVKVLVMEELEAQMLAEAKARGQIGNIDAVNEAIRQKAAFLSKHVGRRDRGSEQSSFNRR